MNIGDLDYDILYRVFRIIASRAEGLVEVSSVCRYWRRLILPHLYDILYVRHSNGVLQSDVQSGSSNEYTKYARELCIHLYDVYIDSSKFITILKKSGIDQAVWPQIRKLEINSYINLEDHGTGADVDSKKAAKDAADILLKHLPNISEIKVSEVTDDYEWDLCHRNPILLVPELASRYSTQLHKIDLFIDSVWLSKGISLPQPLTHLAIVTSDRDSQVLTKIFAPTLQFFRITQLTPDIMWSWFDSGNEKSDIVWFNSLLDLEIGFYDQDHKYYCGTQKSSHRTNDPSDIDQSEAGSEHRYTNKRVHFPVLRRLKLGHYPYVDGSFCDLFIDCPLQEIDITWCNGVGHHLPPQIVLRVPYLELAIHYDWESQRADMDNWEQHIAEKQAIESDLASLMLTPSAAYATSVSLCGDYYTTSHFQTITLPSSIAWHSIRKLSLRFDIDMESVCAVLAELPKLQFFSFKMCDSYVESISSEGHTAEKDGSKCQRVVNRSVDHISICQFERRMSKTVLGFLLPRLLPLVPSLAKLEVNGTLLKACKEIICDPKNHLEWLSDQLEFV